MHHFGSLFAWPVSLLSGSCQFYVLHMLSTEITSCLLHPAVFFLPKHGLKGTTLHTVVGLSLIGAFTIFRILPLPLFILSMWAARSHFWALPPHIFWISVFSLPVPAVLNVYWYCLLVKGALKSLGIIGAGSKKQKRGSSGGSSGTLQSTHKKET